MPCWQRRHETDDSPPIISRVVTGPQAFLATPATSGSPCTTVGIDVGGPCATTYNERQGKDQHQPERVTLAKV
jgi:hypothetical protein